MPVMPADPGQALRLYGTTEPVEPPRRLVAGALSCDVEAGALRHVRWGGVEVLRGIAYLLRDRDWGTVPAVLSGLVIDEAPGRFSLDFVLRMATPAGALDAVAHIEGHADGRLRFTVRATPDAAMETNRCGFVVLHPADCAGRALSVEHTDGSVSETAFPREISPSQPVFDIRCLRHAPADGLRVECRLEAELPGDPAGKFEMEDQRNWSDASFKTYVASLLDPWPYRLPAGRALEQCVDVRIHEEGVHGSAPAAAGAEGGVRELSLGAPRMARMPAIGVGIPPGLRRATAAEHEALRQVGAGWWIVDASLADAGLPEDLRAVAALRQGIAARVQLDLAVPETLAPDEAARQGAALCAQAGLELEAVRLLPAPYLKSYQPDGAWPESPPLDAYASAARRHFPRARIGGGMFTFFTELNRKRPPPNGLDFIGHATCPIVHAADDASVMETLEALPAIVHSVGRLWPGLAYRLGPSTLAAGRNPYGTAPAANPDGRRLALAASDPRHRGLFGAAWTLGYAATVADAGLDVLALHHGHGASGPFGGGDGAALVPAWSVLRTLAAASGFPLVAINGLGAGVAGLAWRRDDGQIEGLVANLGPGDRPLRVRHGDRLASRVLGAYEVAPLLPVD